jgi:predicted Zn finger-like uncharacterized protein
MLTRCPQCQTMFRVSPDQLKVRQGRVRCGRCRGEFNALDTLIDDTPPPLPAVTTATTEPGGIWLSQREADPVLVAPAAPADEPSTALESLPEPLPEPPLPAIQVPPEPLEQSIEPEAPPPVADAVVAAPLAPTAAAPLPLPMAAGPFTLMEMVADDPEPPQRRWPWIVATTFALLALLVHVALHYRVDLAARAPALRPALLMACDLLGCEVPLLTEITAIGIDTSDLHPDSDRPDHLQLAATLRNRSTYAQAWPHLEVTLTDAGDRVLVRKAIPPSDYLLDKQKLDTGFPAKREQAVHIDLQTTDLAAVGYRLYVFYP